MNKKDLFYKFIRKIEKNKLLTLFIKNIFNYKELYDYNYLFRVISETSRVIIDIYDNISKNRFNRYIFDFNCEIDDVNTVNKNNVFLTYININNNIIINNNLSKLAYLFTLNENKMLDYAMTFLDDELVAILETIIKK